MSKRVKVLFIVPYPSEGASNRLRIEQYLPLLKNSNIDFTIRPFVSKKFFKILYKDGYFFLKFFYFIISTLKRALDLLIIDKYDIIFIHREAYPVGPAIFEYIVSMTKKPIIFDFDDAIFMPNNSKHNTFIECFKNPSKVPRIISLSSCVIAGNSYLYDYAVKFNSNVRVIPTPIDTDIYKPGAELISPKNDVVIGWMGSQTTVEFLYILKNVFALLSIKYSNLKFKIIGGNFKISGLQNITCKPWSLNEETQELNSFDIGIMPMPDNAWTKGKCAFKAILYMSMGKPCVCSAVGMNKEVIADGINGFLASSDNEWVDKLSLLIESRETRQRLGLEGRKVVVERFSLKVNAQKYLDVFQAISTY